MFDGATAFNQDIDYWNVAGVVPVYAMFSGATSFCQDISSWDVAKVIQKTGMFSGGIQQREFLRNAW
jgi:surface protein